ncbi:LytR/AlgR family response regulator transcription factor [Butyricimonas synergistica]|uniref:LytR/AlgR family response regulator transcription factor n=1 Tax=Butyricimonas synergistica TaxID=544644 RepID=UPI00037A15F0|nr:LytTR family DNA-binding domain-containing protein [Butyricimonas synergistica]
MDFKKDRIFVWDKDAYCRIFYSEITWLEASRNYCCIHLLDHSKILVANPLQTFENTLPGDRFKRVHRGHMINLEHVDRLRGNTIYIGKLEIPLGQPYRERFLACFDFLGSVKGLHK